MKTQKPLIISVPEPRSLELIFTPDDETQLRNKFEIVEGIGAAVGATVTDNIADATFIIGQPDLSKEILQKATNLKAIFNVESNFLDNMDYEYCFGHGIHVLTTGRVFAVPVAEMGLGLALSLERNIAGADRAFRSNSEVWGGEGNTQARLMTGGQIGFIGFGDLGKALHRVLAGFRANIRVYDPWLPNSILEDAGVTPTTLDDVLTKSDVIFVVASVTSENGGFLDAAEFAAVKSGHIRAASDVFPEEPLAANHELRRLEGFVLSAHRAGALDVAFKQMGRMVLDDMDLLMRGLAPISCRRAERETIRRMRSKPVTKN
jgi:phosphoglycerate dehydrogenase-like enzyme